MNHALHAAFETHSCFKEKAKPSPMLLNFPLHSIREPDVDLCQARQTALSSRHRTPLSSKEPHQHWDMDLFFCSTFWAQSTSWALGEQRGKGQANCFNPRWRPGRLTQILVWRCQRQLMTHATKARERVLQVLGYRRQLLLLGTINTPASGIWKCSQLWSPTIPRLMFQIKPRSDTAAYTSSNPFLLASTHDLAVWPHSCLSVPGEHSA